MADDFLFLTELLGLKVYDLKGRRIGVVKDAALVPLIHPARVDRFLVGGGWAWLTIRHDQIRSISLDGIHLSDEQLTPYHSDEYMLRMVRDLLDQQIIDAQGRKVVRVTDVTLSIQHEADGRFSTCSRWTSASAACSGGWSKGWSLRAGSGACRRAFRRTPSAGRLQHYGTRSAAAPAAEHHQQAAGGMHPADLADIVEDLSPEDREAIFETIDSEVAADTLSEMEPEMQASILESLETEKAADIVEEMSPDEAADVLAELEEETSEEILEEMEAEPKAEVQELLEFEEDTAGGLMNTEYVALPEDATVADAMEALKAHEELLESLNTLFLVDASDQLKAAIPLARLFTAAGATPLQGSGSRNSDSRGGGRAAGPRDGAVRQIQSAGAAGGR